MKSLLLITLLLSGIGGPCRAEPPPEEVFESLSKVIRGHCPEAAIEVTNAEFTAKLDTMEFTLHGRSKTGRVSPRTHQEEGPNYKGFLLSVNLKKDPYRGPTKGSCEYDGPYFLTTSNVVPAPEGKGYYWIRFSYGKGVDPELKQAVFKALPGNTRPMRVEITPPEAPGPVKAGTP